MLPPFKAGLPILEKLNSAGYKAFFVGGAVRDYLLKRSIGDIDIATSAKPEQVKSLFPKTVDIGIEHGTVLVLLGDEGYEVTTFRKESEYKDFRRPEEVEFIHSLDEDLKRRDFTINAIAMDKTGSIYDPFDGQKDLARKVIRCVGNPSERFKEDALRMMRAIRFQSQLGFEIEKKTLDSLRVSGPLLKNIAVERVLIEWTKLLNGSFVKIGIDTLLHTEMHHYIPANHDITNGLQVVQELNINPLDDSEIWAILLYYSSLNAPNSCLKRWKMSNHKQKEILTLWSWLRIRKTKEWTLQSLYQAGLNNALKVEKIFNCLEGNELDTSHDYIKEQYTRLPIKRREELCVNGHDIMNWTELPGSPKIRELLEKIEMMVVEEKLKNEKQKIKEWLEHVLQ
ncbi:CCA tRNA nucleotidyltransferase [Bacillus carboniphilus]|uniref:CCA-adding enzyme n=1 Tax=Bacillus carboniphilus TaxID=86663 RepID=A0ABP3GKK2_9BACI